MASNYLGAFGPVLRRLTAQDAQGGVFDTVQPQPMPLGAPATPAGGALSDVGTPFHRAVGKKADEPVSWRDLFDSLSLSEKDQVADKIEKDVGGDLDAAYKQAAAQQGEKAKKLNRRQMASYLGEVMLRTVQARRGGEVGFGEALSTGVLDTDARRAAVAKEAADREAAMAETRRKEGREDVKTKAEQVFKTGERKGGETFTAEQNRLDRESREKVAAIKDTVKDPKTKVVIGEDGSYFVINEETGQSLPVTVKKTTTKTKGRRGKKWDVTVTENVPVKAAPRANASGVDQDTLVRAIQTQIKTMKEDRRGLRALARELGEEDANSAVVNAEVERRAREIVMKSFESATLGGGLSEDDPLGLLQ